MSTAVLMKQPIAGVFPPQLSEATIMTVWPSLAATSIGRTLGRLYAIRTGRAPLTLGHLIALATIPLVVPLYFGKFIFTATIGGFQLLPKIGRFFKAPDAVRRYVLTNRRVVVRTGLRPIDERWVELDRFDTIDIIVRPGQEWYRAGDLVFRLGPIETFRLEGVVRPQTFRHTCLSASKVMGAFVRPWLAKCGGRHRWARRSPPVRILPAVTLAPLQASTIQLRPRIGLARSTNAPIAPIPGPRFLAGLGVTAADSSRLTPANLDRAGGVRWECTVDYSGRANCSDCSKFAGCRSDNLSADWTCKGSQCAFGKCPLGPWGGSTECCLTLSA